MAEPIQRLRPSCLSCISQYISSDARVWTRYGICQAIQAAPPSERTPLRADCFLTAFIVPASDQASHRPLSNTTVIPRPTAHRATTIAAASHTDPTTTTTSPPIRPAVGRAYTATAALIGRPELYYGEFTSMEHGRPSLLSRAAQIISDHLELGEGASHAHRNAPKAPSYWNDQSHRRHLIRMWDAVCEHAMTSKQQNGVSTATKILSTEKSMIHHFPELGKGDRPLSRDWVEYVLGVSLVHPFCTAENMGRWEVLAASGGARGTWGPW